MESLFRGLAKALTVSLHLLFGSLLALSCSSTADNEIPEYQPKDGPSPTSFGAKGTASVRPPSTYTSESATDWNTLPSSEKGDDLNKVIVGDSLKVEVYGAQFLAERYSGVRQVGSTGSIPFDHFGRVDVLGLGVKEIETRLTSLLDGFLNQPVVNVSIDTFAPRQATIIASFLTSDDSQVNLQKDRKLLSVLAQRGWNPTTSRVSRVTLIRGTRHRVLNFRDLESAIGKANIELNPGDTVICVDTQSITISGAVANQSVIQPDASGSIGIFEAFAKIGGLTEKADPTRIRVLSPDGSAQLVSLEAIANQNTGRAVFLYEGQSVVVPEVASHMYYAFGMIEARNGAYESKEPLTLMQLVALAGVEKFGSRIDNSRLIRGWAQGVESMKVYKIDIKKIIEGDPTGNILLADGDVLFIPETGTSYTLRVMERVLSPVFGLTRGIGSIATGANDIKQLSQD